MSYDGRILRRALARFDEDRQRREENFRERERAVYRKEPRIEQINIELSHTMAKIIASGLKRGTDPRPAIHALQEENLRLQAERAGLLQDMGYPADYLEQKPNCSRCNDTGFDGSEMCSCLRGYYVRAQNEELSQLLDLGTQSFETFNFDYYSPLPDFEQGISPRMNMEKVYDVCQDYAHEFSPRSGSLLLSGDTGLGKTFLSASIARVVSESGEENANDAVDRYLRCDLLIIDDLGTEMTTSFVQSAIYQIVNTRLMTGKKTVISTNLSPDEIGRRYGAAVRSRIEGEYRVLPFFGDDIRKRRKE